MVGKPEDQMYFVIDTNVLVDYPDILPGGSDDSPEEPTVDLTGAHLIIPTAVIRELSSFKGEKSERGRAARNVLRRLRRIVESKKAQSIYSAYHLGEPMGFDDSDVKISILPVHKNFKNSLPFAPSENDMDGQIILATLTVAFLNAEYTIDGTYNNFRLNDKMDNIVLLTNDNGLAIRAHMRGITTMRYGYKYPDPYTGRRDIFVPSALFYEFFNTGRIDRDLFEEFMPKEKPLVANEFIIMALEDEEAYPRDYNPANDYYSNIGRYDAEEDAIVPLKYVSSFPVIPKNAGQAIYAEALMNPKFSAVICTGPAGSGKTFMPTVYGYNACKRGEYIGVTVVPCESQSKIGALPGDLDDKMDPDVQPIKNALRNYLLYSDSKLEKELLTLKKFGTDSNKCKKNGESGDENGTDKRSIKAKLKDRVDLIWVNWFTSIPVESARGRDFAYELAIYDEFQDQNAVQADTLIKRIGTEGKIIITGDVEQIHAPYLDQTNNGLVYAARLLYDNPMVAQVCFTEEEVVRHPLVRMVAKRQKNRKNTANLASK